MSQLVSIGKHNTALIHCAFIRDELGHGYECFALCRLDAPDTRPQQVMIPSSPPAVAEMKMSPDGEIVAALEEVFEPDNGALRTMSQPVPTEPRVERLVLFRMSGSRCGIAGTFGPLSSEGADDVPKYQWSPNSAELSLFDGKEIIVVGKLPRVEGHRP